MAISVTTFEILGVKVSAVDLDLAAGAFADFIREQKKAYVCVAPVSTIMSCQDDAEYKRIVNAADLVTPDGMPVVWLARRKGFKTVHRTYGPDLMRKVCDEGRTKNYRHYLLGGTDETNQKLAEALNRNYPGIKIVGRAVPPFRVLSSEEQTALVNEINAARADIVWVGLGSPKQDFWMAQNRAKLNAPVLIGVGAAFDFLAGTKIQAPRWIRRIAMEWFFRLCCEPRRLWRRYFFGNIRFLYLLAREAFWSRQ